MRHSVDPKQNQLFDPDIIGFSPVALRRLQEDWPGVIRHCILELMPVDLLGDRFHDFLGRPTKELYSMCGLVFLMEFRDWTAEQAADAYMFDRRTQFALNLGPDGQSMTTRTVERYRALFREKELAAEVMERVTGHLVDLLDVSVERQRLDSTHVFSNMALFGRTRLMLTVVRSFLTQVKRHERASFDALPEELRERYEKKSWEFANGTACRLKREQAAEDMLLLITTFEENEDVVGRTTFKDLFRVFHEQCELVGGSVKIKEKPGGSVMQNPSDPDATYDGHKGPGYQLQLSETCGEENDVQLVTAAIPQTACEQDQAAVDEILTRLDEAGHGPETLLADGGYGSDENCCGAAEKGVELIAPVNSGGRKPDRFALEDFGLAGDGSVEHCPTGLAPCSSGYDPETGKGYASFGEETCGRCKHLGQCPVHRHHGKFRIRYTEKDLRLAQRREFFKTPEGRKEYSPRSGIEGTFSRAKAVTGLGRLRVRGMASVSMALLLKTAGMNVLRALDSKRMRKILAEAFGNTIPDGCPPQSGILMLHGRPQTALLAA